MSYVMIEMFCNKLVSSCEDIHIKYLMSYKHINVCIFLNKY